MSFDADVIKEGRGRVIRVDVSTDNFATIAYRYGDVAGELDGANMYSSRVVEMGSVKRALGNNRIAASSTTSLTLDNADGSIDWICGRENIATAAAARFRIYVALYESGVSPPVFTAKLLGEFMLSSWPRQNNATVQLQLADDFMGKLGAGLLLPTLLDWQGVGTTANNPIKNSIGLPSSLSVNTPIQLAFGEDVLQAFPHIIPWGTNGSGQAYEGTVIVPLYSTLDTGAVSQNLVTQVVVNMIHAPRFGAVSDPSLIQSDETNVEEFVNIPRNLIDQVWIDNGIAQKPNWKVEKSPTITKGGLNFQIVYLVVRTHLGLSAGLGNDEAGLAPHIALEKISGKKYLGGYPQTAVDTSDNAYRAIGCRALNWYARIVPGSQRTNPPALIPIAHAIDVMIDLVSQYSSATVDATSAARVKSGVPFAACSGVVQPWTERANNPSDAPSPRSLRQVLTELAQSSDFDVFIDWSGRIAFSSDVWDLTTSTQAGTLLEIYETEISDMERWVASDGERGQAFNRVVLEGGKSDPTSYQEVPFQGPFDIAAADIPTSTRSIEVVLRQGWRPFRQQSLDPVRWRSVDGVTRDRIRFRMHIGGLRLELGAYFKLTWSRGSSIGGPYLATTDNAPNTVFQCEGITYSPGDDVVEIEAIWRDDTQSERQYLLDDEALLVRSKGAMSGSATTSTGSDVISFGGTINLTTMGVQAGDILILRDSSEADDLFARNTCLRIDTVDTATQVTCVQQVATGGVVVNADWSIVRGKTTYPTAISDPTNYPSGGDIYGKATDAGGLTSDSEAGNRLISG